MAELEFEWVRNACFDRQKTSSLQKTKIFLQQSLFLLYRRMIDYSKLALIERVLQIEAVEAIIVYKKLE